MIEQVGMDQAIARAAVFTHVEMDDAGEERVVSIAAARARPATHITRLRVLAVFGDTPDSRHQTFVENPICVDCTEPLVSADAGGIVPTEQGLRLAHRHGCFARAMMAHNPNLAIQAAVRRLGRER